MGEGEPLALSLRFLRPLGTLLGDNGLEELVGDLGLVVGRSSDRTSIEDGAQILLDSDNDSTFFPGLSCSSHGGRSLIFLPTTFWQDPALARTGLNEENFGLVGRERDDSSNQAFTFGAVACRRSAGQVFSRFMINQRWLSRPVRDFMRYFGSGMLKD